MGKSHVYILKFFNHPKSFKVGKANCLELRISQLEKSWGKCDLKSSYSLTTTQTKVNKLERSLHLLLSDDKADMKSCSDGYTEFFNIDAMDECLSLASVYSAKLNLKLTSGIVATKKTKENVAKKESKPSKALKPSQSIDEQVSKWKSIVDKINVLEVNNGVITVSDDDKLSDELLMSGLKDKQKSGFFFVSFIGMTREIGNGKMEIHNNFTYDLGVPDYLISKYNECRDYLYNHAQIA